MSYTFDDEEEIEPMKYQFGAADVRLPKINDYTLLFAFDYLSLYSTKLCFNNPHVTAEDFIKIFEFNKRASKITIKDFTDNNELRKLYHFHDIQFSQKQYLKNPFEILLGKKFKQTDNLPTLYQFAIFTDNNTLKAPRIVGFFGKRGVFHVLWLDYEHSIFPMK